MNLSTKVAYNTLIQIASKVIATILGLAGIAIVTRYLGQAGFGQYTTIMTILSFFAIVADLGLTLVTVQLISRPDADEKAILSNLFGLRLATAAFFLGLAPVAAIFLPYSRDVKLGIAVAALSFFFIALNQIFVGLFQKHLRLDKVSIAEVASRLLLLAAIILAVRYDQGLFGVLIATVLSSFLAFLLHYLFSRRFVRISLKFDLAYWKLILTKSWPLAATIFFNMIYLRADTLLLSLIPRHSEIGIIGEVGVYGAAYKVIDVLTTFPFMFAGIVLPIMTARWAENNRDAFAAVLQRSFDFMAIVALPIVVATQFLARDIMIFVAGNDFALSGPILQILIIAVGFIFLGNMFAHAVIAIDRQRRIIGAYIFTAVTAVAGYLFFIPRYSYFGAAGVTIYSEAVIAAASLYLVWRYSAYRPRFRIFLKAAAAAAIMGAALYYAERFWAPNLLLSLIFASAVYFISLYAFRGLTKQDFLYFVNRK